MINDKGLNIFSKKQLLNLYSYADDIINTMPPKVLDELLGGYENDVDDILSEIINQTSNVMNFPVGLESEDIHYLSGLESHMDERLKKLSYNYFKTTVLGDSFDQGWRNLEWGNLAQIYPWGAFLCARESGKSFEWSFAFPLWRLYSYDKPIPGVRDNRDNKNRKETCIISNEKGLVRKHVAKINQEVLSNDILAEKLNPGRRAFPADSITTETGSSLWIKSYGSAIRGLHVGAAVIDDFLDASSLYSAEQRSKFNEIFFSEILNIVNEGGFLQVIGCVAPNSIVSTSEGLRKIGDMSPLGSFKNNKKLINLKKSILGKDGFRNSSHYWHNGWTKTKKITLKGGFEIECSLVHPLLKMGKDHSSFWEKSSNLEVGDWIALKIGGGVSKNAQKIDFSEASSVDRFDRKAKSVVVNKNNYKDLIYLVGLYTADGSFEKSGRLTIVKKNVGIQSFLRDNVLGLDFKPSQEYKFRCQSVVLKSIFEHAGCNFLTAVDKNFPSRILEADEDTLIYFLQGLFDGDGNCYVTGCGSIQITLGSISESLISDVHNILGYLGIISSKRKQGPGVSKKVKGVHEIHKCVITGYDARLFLEKIGFVHSGKGDKVSAKTLNRIKESNSKFRKTPFTPKDGLNYLKIINIEDSENWTVDFHIPDGHNFVSNCMISHNTPFHQQDLYYDLKQSPEFQVFEYPAILPNGTVLAPDRFSIEQLRKKKSTLSPIQYAREILITPLADGSTIFPVDTLMNSTIGMERVSLINNADSLDMFPVKFARIVVGCDFAKSANIGADFSVFSVWGACPQGNFYLLHIWRKQGASYNEQLQQIVSINRRFKPNRIVVENNGFQSWMAEGLRAQGLHGIVKPFTTTAQNKKDLYLGLPSLATMFERGQIKIPFKDGVSRDTANWLFGEFNSITFNSDNGKLESTAGHDDGPMSSFMAVQDLRDNTAQYKFYYA